MLGGDALPRRLLTPVLAQLGRSDPIDQASERPAGFDLEQLAGISNEDHLGPGIIGRLDESAQRPGAGRTGLVEDDNVAGPELGRPR